MAPGCTVGRHAGPTQPESDDDDDDDDNDDDDDAASSDEAPSLSAASESEPGQSGHSLGTDKTVKPGAPADRIDAYDSNEQEIPPFDLKCIHVPRWRCTTPRTPPCSIEKKSNSIQYGTCETKYLS